MLALALLLAVTPVQDTLRYQFEMHQDQDIDMSAMGGEGMSQTLGASGRFTLLVRDTVGGRAYTLRIDTAEVTSSNPMMAGMLKIPSGLEMSWATIDGESVMLESDDPEGPEALGLGLMAQAIGAFELDLPGTLDTGHTWTDTTSADGDLVAQGVNGTGVVHWVVSERVGDDVVLLATDTTSVSMEMEQASTSGVMTGTRRIVLRPDRLPREATSEQGGDMQMLMAGQPMTMTQRTRTSLLLLP